MIGSALSRCVVPALLAVLEAPTGAATTRPAPERMSRELTRAIEALAPGRAMSFWVFNGSAVSATAAVVRAIAARPEVASLGRDATFKGPAAAPDTAAAGPFQPGGALHHTTPISLTIR